MPSNSRSRSLFLDSLSLFSLKFFITTTTTTTTTTTITATCTILFKKFWTSPFITPDSSHLTFPLLPYHQGRRRKPGVAGGSKWTYEATFLIAMKGGQEYYTTAAVTFLLFLLFRRVWLCGKCMRNVVASF